jgi:hypothetical protein
MPQLGRGSAGILIELAGGAAELPLRSGTGIRLGRT